GFVADQQFAIADHQSGTSLVLQYGRVRNSLHYRVSPQTTSYRDKAECTRMFQIGDWRWRIADVGNASCFVSAMNTQTSRPQVLQNRLISHAADILDISATLPKTPQATHISRQLLRAGTAAAANYGEARGAESVPTSCTSSGSCSKNSTERLSGFS